MDRPVESYTRWSDLIEMSKVEDKFYYRYLVLDDKGNVIASTQDYAAYLAAVRLLHGQTSK